MSGSPAENLSDAELAALVRRVFKPRAGESRLGLLTDLPDAHTPDHARWAARRRLVGEWFEGFRRIEGELGLEPKLFVYRNVRANNADLPEAAWEWPSAELPSNADELDPEATIPFREIFDRYPMLIAPTQFSTTAPLKNAARHHALRAATMPGFSAAMIPALRLDYGEIDRRVRWLKELLDRAEGADFRFETEAGTDRLHLDLRHRQGHASGGLVTEPGQAGNLPSGETYIVPYEGEIEGDPSRSRGIMPVELEGELVRYRIENNKAVEVLGSGPVAEREAALIRAEPGYANLAELGLGVLDDFGLEPIGEILLDEKLGPHIAFGRSDHFGGQVGPDQFSAPEAVIHIDRIYLPQTQPGVKLAEADLHLEGGGRLALIREGRYALDFR